MLAPDFDPRVALAALACPRCRTLGLIESDDTAHQAAPERDHHVPRFHVDPSVYCRCPACGLEAAYPGLLGG